MNFPEALRQSLTQLMWTQTKLGVETNIPLQQLNKYVTGKISAGPEVIEQICAALPEAQRAAVIVAYLQDRVPESGIDLVKISSYAGKTGKAPKLPTTLPADVREALESLAHHANIDRQFGRLLVLLNDTLSRTD